MSTYEPSYDAALLSAPWHALPSPSRLILKYAPHPSRPGYILLLTDLSSVYCEVLTGPSVPMRITQVDRAFNANGTKKGKGKGKSAELDEDDVIGRSEAALASVGELWTDIGEAEVEMKDHDYHDAVLSVQTDDFSWLFYLTELKGRQPLDVLSKHLIAPLAGILLETNNIKTEGKNEPMELVHTLFQQSPTITQHMANHHAGSAPKTSTAAARSKRPATPPPSRPASSRSKATKSPAKPKPTSTPARKPVYDTGEEEEYVSEEELEQPPVTRSRDTPTKPRSKGKPRSKSISPDPTPPAPTKESPAKAKSRHVIESDPEIEAEDDVELKSAAEDPVSEIGSAEKSVSPPPPTMSSQASKKEKERLEEEEMKARAEAMKRKMEGGGGGGGNLGRRRLRR